MQAAPMSILPASGRQCPRRGRARLGYSEAHVGCPRGPVTMRGMTPHGLLLISISCPEKGSSHNRLIYRTLRNTNHAGQGKKCSGRRPGKMLRTARSGCSAELLSVFFANAVGYYTAFPLKVKHLPPQTEVFFAAISRGREWLQRQHLRPMRNVTLSRRNLRSGFLRGSGSFPKQRLDRPNMASEAATAYSPGVGSEVADWIPRGTAIDTPPWVALSEYDLDGQPDLPGASPSQITPASSFLMASTCSGRSRLGYSRNRSLAMSECCRMARWTLAIRSST